MPRCTRLLPALFFAPFALCCGCPKPSATTPPPAANTLNPDPSAGAFAQTDPWLLNTTDPNANRGNHGIFLGNGYLGATFGPNCGAGKDGVCLISGVYDKRENLLLSPVWNAVDLPATKSGDYSQTLDMKRGVLVTKMGGVTITAFVSRYDKSLAVIHVEGASLPENPFRVPAPPGWTETGSSPAERIWNAAGKRGVGTTTTYTMADSSALTADVEVTQVPDAQSNGWTRFVYVFSKSAADESYVDRYFTTSYQSELEAHTKAWATLWKHGDIRIEGDPEAQQLVHKLMFDLLQSARPGGDDSIAPESLSGNFYKGHIFWDAEVWMFPALLAQHPDLARTLLDYRFKHLAEAKRRANAEGFAGADFPWESAATGKETAPGGFDTGRHVTAGVGWAHWQYWRASRDKTWLRERGWPVLSAVADHFASRAKKNPATGKYDIRSVFGPDESAGKVDNNTYTNALARYCLQAAGAAAKIIGKPANPAWASVAASIALPYDKANDRYLARENDNGRPTKQADGELVLYPAALPMKDNTARNTFAYHAARPIKNGPAMTASIHALLAARLGLKNEAERAFRESYRPFVRGPFLLFSEKRSLDRCVFTTGAGGILQSILYGFGDLRWEDFDDPGAAAKRPVTLPPSWKKLTITGIRHAGKTYTLIVTPQGRTLTPTTQKKKP